MCESSFIFISFKDLVFYLCLCVHQYECMLHLCMGSQRQEKGIASLGSRVISIDYVIWVQESEHKSSRREASALKS